jgi:catechol 2,3-dioxygenase-like lactoylglutathione lyase family enzyme
MSSHLGLLMLLVRDVPRAKAFYTEYLGLEAVPQFSSDEFVLLRSQTGVQILPCKTPRKRPMACP